MNLKKEICEALNPPEPKERDIFVEALPYPGLTYFEFVLSQIGYIRKRMWIVSALVPFLAVLASAEIARSSIFGMSEIETGCRFALPQLAGARMLILGVCSFAVISACAVISGVFSPFGIAVSALYILTPYICVCGISLAVFGRTRGQEGVYISAAAAMLVSITGVILFSGSRVQSMEINMGNPFLVLCGAGAALTISEAKKILTGKDVCYGIEN